MELANALNNLGAVSIETGDTRLAADSLQRALGIAEEIGARELLIDCCEHMTDLHQGLGDTAKALHYHRQFARERSLVFSDEISGRVAAMQARIESQRITRNSLLAGLLGLLAVSAVITLVYRKQASSTREIARKNDQLEKALNEIDTLRGMFPICSYCKKIRDDTGLWHQIEKYIRDHSEADFSHGICPDCVETELAELDES